MRHEWARDNPAIPSAVFLLFVSQLQSGEPFTNASEGELMAEVLRLAQRDREHEAFVVDLIGSLGLTQGSLELSEAPIPNQLLEIVGNLTKRVRGLEEQQRLDALCDVCAGTGKPVSGYPCACRGTGSMRETVAHLRVVAMIDQPARIADLEEDLALARAGREAALEIGAKLEEENARLRASVEAAKEDFDSASRWTGSTAAADITLTGK